MPGFFRGSLLQRNTTDGRGLPKCGKCGFATQCESPRLPVGGEGSTNVLLVGEAPGSEEDERGEHFVGEEGERLRLSLQEIGQEYDASWHTYSMICRPKEVGKFSDVNIEACRPSLLRTMDELKPRVVVLLGAAPVRSLMPSERNAAVGAIDRWVGFQIPSHQHQAWLCPTYSMATLLSFREDPALVRMFNNHLRAAFRKVKETPVTWTMKELWAKVETIDSPRLARKRLKKLAKQEGVLAFDYESTCLKPDGDDPRRRILAASFCLNGDDTFALLIKNEETLRALSPVLRSPRTKKVGSNIKFEERWTRAKLGHGVTGWFHDTMLAAHCLDNRKGVTSVKFQAFLYRGVPDYDRFVEPYMVENEAGFNKLATMDPKDLLNYNGLDSLLEYMVTEEQRKDMGLV